MGASMVVSIITPVWNHYSDLTESFINNLFANTEGEFELIVVDNGSTDETRLKLRNFKGIKYIRSEKNLGFSGGNNLGYKHAKGEYICFISNDVIISSKDWLKRLVEESDSCLTGPMLVDFNEYTSFRYRTTPYITGFCVFGSRILFEKVKQNDMIWDENFGKAYFEDVDLSVKAVKAGFKIKEIKGLGLTHLISKSSDQINIQEQFQYTRKVWWNKMYQFERGDKLRIVFYCPGNYQFSDGDFEGKGVGGAEASLILLCRELVKLGYIVDIYNNNNIQGNYHGVNYNHISNYHPDEYADIFILFRSSYEYLQFVNSPLKIFWSCDQYTSNDWGIAIIPYIHKVIAISDYHKDYLLKHYSFRKEDIYVLDLGVNKEDYLNSLPKQKGKLIYCSVPRRGLVYLKDIFPKIREQVPYAELYITSDYRLWGAEALSEEFTAVFGTMEEVHYLGKIPRSELIYHQLTSELMIYPCDYDENFCISAMECISAGTPPITTLIGALETTVSNTGVLIKGLPKELRYQEQFISETVRLLKDDNARNILSGQCKKRGITYYWENLTKEKWLPLFDILFKEAKLMYKSNYCTVCKEKFPNAFEFFKHRNQQHFEKEKYKDAIPAPKGVVTGGVPQLFTLIKTRMDVDVSIGSKFWKGKELLVPQEYASEVVRLINEFAKQAGLESIIESAQLRHVV